MTRGAMANEGGLVLNPHPCPPPAYRERGIREGLKGGRGEGRGGDIRLVYY